MKPFRLGPYLLLEQIGKGGMAQVYRGQWHGEGDMLMPVAVKMMRAEVAANLELRRMFVDEARISMLLSHANICRVLPSGSDPQPYIAMEWVNGLNLSELTDQLRISRRLLPFDLIGHIIHSILLALEAAHTLVVGGEPFPIIHRDVSPQNVMISVRGEVKLMDFGIARVLVDETSPAEYAGKLRYSPWEQIMGRVKPATDLFAVGAILHELVEGSLFRADYTTKEEMLAAIERGQLPMLTRPGVPEQFRKLHKALLQSNIADRPQSAGEAIAMLGPVIAAQTRLGQIISAELGPQARVSGSTLGHRVASEVGPLPDFRRQEVGAPQQNAKAAREDPPAALEGEVIARTPTAVVSNRGAAAVDEAKPHEETSGAAPKPRTRPHARWMKAAEHSQPPRAAEPPEASEPPETPEPPLPDAAPGQHDERREPVAELSNDDDASPGSPIEEDSDPSEITTVARLNTPPRPSESKAGGER